jgi:hypothetical protein
MLRVTAIRDDGSWWGVDARTVRHALKAARRLRWQHGWLVWIESPEQPANTRLIDCWHQWQLRRQQLEAWQRDPIGGVH